MNPKALIGLLRAAFARWQEDQAAGLAAALAYYTIFSIAPLLLIAIAIAGAVLGQAAVRGQLVDQISGVVGPDSARIIEQAVQSASKPGAGILATIIGAVTLLLGASGIFGQLRGALNTIWRVDRKKQRSFLKAIQEQVISFLMVFSIGFLLLASLAASTAVTAFGGYVSSFLPVVGAILPMFDFFVSFSMITLLFGAIYKVLPDAEIAWSDVWLGAIFTALLFTIGKLLIGLYLGKASVGSAYGPAGGLLVILVWIYYSAQLFFFGAEFTRMYAERHGSRSASAGNAGQTQGLSPAQDGARRADRTSAPPSAILRLLDLVKMPILTTVLAVVLYRVKVKRVRRR